MHPTSQYTMCERGLHEPSQRWANHPASLVTPPTLGFERCERKSAGLGLATITCDRKSCKGTPKGNAKYRSESGTEKLWITTVRKKVLARVEAGVVSSLEV